MKEYNGWTNYATWNINLWLTNDEGSYNYWMERARDSEVNELATALEDEHKEGMPEFEPSRLYRRQIYLSQAAMPDSQRLS